MRKVCGIVFLVLAGIFFSAASQLGIMGFQEQYSLLFLAVMMAPGLVFLLIGVAFMGFRRWRRDTGIVLLVTAGVTAFSLLTWACMLMDDAFVAVFEAQGLPKFAPSYVNSSVILAIFAALGWLLYRSAPADAGASVEPSTR